MSEQIVRNKDGTFAKGHVANPTGKPIGTISRTVKLRNLIADRMQEVIDTMINAAIGGDVQAARVLIERVLPAVKSESLPVNIALPDKASLADIGNSIISAIAQGQISVEAGVQLMSALTGQAKLVEVTELERRIESIENAQSKQDQQS